MEPESVGLLREGDAAEGVVVPELQSEAHVTDPTAVSTSLFPEGYRERRALYRAFVDEHVIPAEAALNREDDTSLELVASLQQRAREAGLWAPHMPACCGRNR